jgi:translation initiation factor IF-1
LAKDDNITLTGTVVEVLPGATVRVKLNETNKEIIGYISGRMRQNNIKVLMGDDVEIEVSPYDLNKGRVTRRK